MTQRSVEVCEEFSCVSCGIFRHDKRHPYGQWMLVSCKGAIGDYVTIHAFNFIAEVQIYGESLYTLSVFITHPQSQEAIAPVNPACISCQCNTMMKSFHGMAKSF